jgi:hypothetical protein
METGAPPTGTPTAGRTRRSRQRVLSVAARHSQYARHRISNRNKTAFKNVANSINPNKKSFANRNTHPLSTCSRQSRPQNTTRQSRFTNNRIPNRHTSRLENAIGPTKQSIATKSNRHFLRVLQDTNRTCSREKGFPGPRVAGHESQVTKRVTVSAPTSTQSAA